MNRIDRLTAILIHLQSKRIVKAKEIAGRFKISIRTVYRDIRALEDAGVPIGAQAGEGYSIIEGYHLPPVMFSRQEAGALLIGGKLIEKFSDDSVSSQFESALYKIRSVLSDADKEYIDNLNTNVEVLKHTGHEKDGHTKDFLSDLQSQVARHKITEIEYHSGYKDETTTRLIEPIGLCFWGANWHLIAFCTLRNEYRDFRVTRIKRLTATGMIFDADRHESLQDLVQKLLPSEKMKPAVVRFEKSAATEIKEQKYYFGLVSEKDMGDRVEMHFLSSSYSYLSNWLMTFTDKVEIVSPNELMNLLRHKAKELYQHYR
ncbi:MAG: YafY family transcriptional regulator [Proteobacteria bacterium]|nr:YafY family transcriptional regulator [Pseudomonadota bacterium]